MSANPKEAAELAAGKPDSYLKLGNIYDTLNVEDPPNCVKGLFIAAPDKLEDMRIVLSKRFKNKINIVKSAETFLEILNVKASKGNGLKHAMKMRNIKADEIIVFGDEENDLSMFKVAGFSCTPSNAKPRIKEEAKLVIASNAENGVAEFLAQNFL
jgi:Cof subfamily protein (haloacid dehalogenase superfamily)